MNKKGFRGYFGRFGMPVPPRFGNPNVDKFGNCVERRGLMLSREAKGPSCVGRNELLLKVSGPKI